MLSLLLKNENLHNLRSNVVLLQDVVDCVLNLWHQFIKGLARPAEKN